MSRSKQTNNKVQIIYKEGKPSDFINNLLDKGWQKDYQCPICPNRPSSPKEFTLHIRKHSLDDY